MYREGGLPVAGGNSGTRDKCRGEFRFVSVRDDNYHCRRKSIRNRLRLTVVFRNATIYNDSVDIFT